MDCVNIGQCRFVNGNQVSTDPRDMHDIIQDCRFPLLAIKSTDINISNAIYEKFDSANTLYVASLFRNILILSEPVTLLCLQSPLSEAAPENAMQAR